MMRIFALATIAVCAVFATDNVALAQSGDSALRDEIVSLKRALGRVRADLKTTEKLLGEEREVRERLERQLGKAKREAAPASADEVTAMRYRSALKGDVVSCSLQGETRLDGDWTPFRKLEFTLVRGEAKAIELYSETRREDRRAFADLSADRRTVRICREARKGRCTALAAENLTFEGGAKGILNADRLLKNASISCAVEDVRKFR